MKLWHLFLTNNLLVNSLSHILGFTTCFGSVMYSSNQPRGVAGTDVIIIIIIILWLIHGQYLVSPNIVAIFSSMKCKTRAQPRAKQYIADVTIRTVGFGRNAASKGHALSEINECALIQTYIRIFHNSLLRQSSEDAVGSLTRFGTELELK